MVRITVRLSKLLQIFRQQKQRPKKLEKTFLVMKRPLQMKKQNQKKKQKISSASILRTLTILNQQKPISQKLKEGLLGTKLLKISKAKLKKSRFWDLIHLEKAKTMTAMKGINQRQIS